MMWMDYITASPNQVRLIVGAAPEARWVSNGQTFVLGSVQVEK